MGLFDNIDWGGLLNAGVNLYASHQNAGANQQAANNFAQQVKFNPYNVTTGSGAVRFNGNNVAATLNPTNQALQNQMYTGAGGLLSGAQNFYNGGGGMQGVNDAFNTYNNSQNNPLANQFNASASGFLNQLGSTDPNQLASSYTSLLRQGAQPGNQRAADSLASRLFNSGGLGSTGGANLMGGLQEAQDQQDLGFQLAGRQYGGQEQSRIAGLAGGMAQQGDALQNATNARAQQRFMNAMQMFGAGQQNAQGQLGAGMGMLNGAMGMDQSLLQSIGMGGYLGGASSNAAAVGGQQQLQAGIAANNANSAGWLGLLGQSGLTGMAGDALSNWLNGSLGDQIGNMGNQASNDILNNPNMKVQPINPGYNNAGGLFSGAGGQAAGNGGSNFLGGLASIPNGLQNLDYQKLFSGMNDQQLQQALGSTGAMNAIDNIGGSNVGNLAGGAAGLLGAYQGIKQGGVKGYANAAAGAANAASSAGLISSGTGSAISSGLGQVVGGIDAIGALGKKEGKFAGTAHMAADGYQIAGPWGALVGGIVGYLKEGGAHDAAPWDAAGMSGTTMDQAWQDQNIARLASNPAAAVASKLGVKSNSVLGKMLDPSAVFQKHGDEKRNMMAFNKAFPGIQDLGNDKFALPDGKELNGKQIQSLAGAWYGMTYHPDGDQEGWQKKFMDQMKSLYEDSPSAATPSVTPKTPAATPYVSPKMQRMML